MAPSRGASFGWQRGYLLAAALLATWPSVAHAIFGKIGSEFQVNAYTTGDQGLGRVATDTTGGFLVVWEDDGQNSGDIRAQRYASTGAMVGTEFRVNAYTTAGQAVPAVAFNPSGPGGFLVVWDDLRFGPFDVFGNVVVGTSSVFPSDTQLNTYSTNDQFYSAAATLSNGGGIIVWASDNQDGSGRGIFGQRRSSVGSPVGTEFQINTYTTGDQSAPSVAADTSGGFIVAWEDFGTADVDIAAQRYDSAGAAVGTEFRVNTNTTGFNRRPAVAADANGGFVVVWSRIDSGTFPVLAQRFDSSGTALGTELVVTTGIGQRARVARGSDGGFLVVWENGNGNLGIAGRRFDSNGAAVGTEFQVNTNTNGNPFVPDVAADATGGFVVVWTDSSVDGSYDVFGQRLGQTDLCPDTPVSGCRAASKSVLLIKNDADDTKDKLIWKWINGQSTTDVELGDPTTTRTYGLCVYDGSGRLIATQVPPSATKWMDLKYKDTSRSADGIDKILLKPGASNNTKILVKGKGANLPDATLGSLPAPITAQVINDETGLCFEAVYAAGDVIKNGPTLLKAKK